MYRLVIVEDELPIRRALCELMPWEKIGFTVVASFENAAQAEEFLEHDTCDVILTDIVMGGGDGISLAKHISENHRHIRVVILSGYSEFSYAQKAIEYDVTYYLVKPVNEIELMEKFEAIRAALDEEREDADTDPIENNLRAAFARLVEYRCFGSLTELLTNMHLLQIPEVCLDCPLLVERLTYRTPIGEETVGYEFFLHIEELLNEFSVSQTRRFLYFVIPDNAGVTVMAFALSDIGCDTLRDHALRKLEQLRALLLTRFGVETEVQEEFSLDRLSAAATEPASGHVGGERTEQKRQDILPFLVKYYRLLMVAFEMRDIERVWQILQDVRGETAAVSDEMLCLLMNDLLMAVVVNCGVRGRAGSVPEGVLPIRGAGLNRDEIFTCAGQALESIGSLLMGEEEEAGSVYPIIGHVKAYIGEHLSEDLRIEVLADMHNISASYLSRLFSQAEGEPISTYILRMRIEHAIALMKTNKYKIQNIVQMCGFQSPSYFSTVFKKHTGLAPSEYNLLLRSGRENS